MTQKATNKKGIVLGSGPIRFGQGIEFDYARTPASIAILSVHLEQQRRRAVPVASQRV